VTFGNLRVLVSAVAEQEFKEKYNYEYKGQGTITIPLPADGRVPSATAGICSFNNINDNGVENFVDNRILRWYNNFPPVSIRAHLIFSGLELGYIKGE
jgi:hypothetical protein